MIDISKFRGAFVCFLQQNQEILPVWLGKRLPGMNSIIATSKLYKLEAMDYDSVDTSA